MGMPYLLFNTVPQNLGHLIALKFNEWSFYFDFLGEKMQAEISLHHTFGQHK
jgi:hypothetical protein